MFNGTQKRVANCSNFYVSKPKRTDRNFWAWVDPVQPPWTTPQHATSPTPPKVNRAQASITSSEEEDLSPFHTWALWGNATPLEKMLMLGVQEEKGVAKDEMAGRHHRLTQWTWVGANSGRWWRTGKPSVLQSMGSQRVRLKLASEQEYWESSYHSVWFI